MCVQGFGNYPEIMNISETLILGVDIIPGDEPTITVAIRNGIDLHIINTIQGTDAVIMYDKLIGNIKV